MPEAEIIDIRVIYYLSNNPLSDETEKNTGIARAQAYLGRVGEYKGSEDKVIDNGATLMRTLMAAVSKEIALSQNFDSTLNQPVIRGGCGAGEVW
jgi:hypothetical protein